MIQLPLFRHRLLPAFTTLLLGWAGGAASGQTSEISLEVGGSTVSPPAGVEGEKADFLVAGLRGFRFSSGGSGVSASFFMGRALDDGSGGDFFSGDLWGGAFKPLADGWSLGLEGRGFGFRVEEPFPYRSIGGEGGPTLRLSRPAYSATLRGIVGGGWSETELERTGRQPSEIVQDELWRYGGTGEFLAGKDGILAGISLGIHESSGGTYRSTGLRVLASWGGSALEARLDAWDTPAGFEGTGGIAFIIPFGGWSARGFAGRTEPDPLTLAEPGGGSGGVLLGRRLFGKDPLPPPRPPLHKVVERTAEITTVEIFMDGPRDAGQIDLIGDFTLWEPVPMVRDGSKWRVRLNIPPGTHHFGFLADGTWYLPEDAPDTVPDEWGRRNATLVIEG